MSFLTSFWLLPQNEQDRFELSSRFFTESELPQES